jgi:Eukaryotic aspartyl protease
VPEFGNITNQPKIPVQKTTLKSAQHWTGTIDAIIGPDGKSISLDSVVVDTPTNKLITIIDTGFTLPQLPRDVSDAIYGRVQGASYDTTNGWWTIPCDQEVNLTFVFAGQNYPIHPLDTSSSDISASTSNGAKMCVGTVGYPVVPLACL